MPMKISMIILYYFKEYFLTTDPCNNQKAMRLCSIYDSLRSYIRFQYKHLQFPMTIALFNTMQKLVKADNGGIKKYDDDD